MQLLRGSLINAISWRSGNESLALKIAFEAFFSLGLFSMVVYASNYIRCEIFMLVSTFARSTCSFTLTEGTKRLSIGLIYEIVKLLGFSFSNHGV